MLEPQFALERFRKELKPHDWKFFTFHTQSHLQLFADSVPELESDQGVSDESRSSESSSSSDESSQEPVSPRPAKASKRVQKDSIGAADEAILGLHRKTWHMMVQTEATQANLPVWQDQHLKTACGRFLPQTRIQLGMQITLEPGHVFCSHVGCRKGFHSLGME